jgi:A/G-specific adenine glycosylase
VISPRKTPLSFSASLKLWRREHARHLPWSGTRDPYAVWISEIMLAQTRVAAVIPYYLLFLKKFPDVNTLAHSRVEQVLKIWEGLGYYRRARDLHAAARQIVNQQNGQFPRDAGAWEKLPGVGKYTAAAIAAFAFGEKTPALDANVRRILARVFCYHRSSAGSQADRALGDFYTQARGTLRPDMFLQAMMDLGQKICTPRVPRCDDCPVAEFCLAKKRNLQNRIPRKKVVRLLPHYQVTAAVLYRGERMLLAQRKMDALLGGMWEFPGGKQERGETLETCLRRELFEELGVHVRVGELLLKVPHAFTHFRITLHVFRCDNLRGTPKPLDAATVRWVRLADLHRFPMGKADRVVANWLCSHLAPKNIFAPASKNSRKN